MTRLPPPPRLSPCARLQRVRAGHAVSAGRRRGGAERHLQPAGGGPVLRTAPAQRQLQRLPAAGHTAGRYGVMDGLRDGGAGGGGEVEVMGEGELRLAGTKSIEWCEPIIRLPNIKLSFQ